jgi:hypothetical protein
MTAARKVTEIDEAPPRLELDLRELEGCLPAPLAQPRASSACSRDGGTALVLRYLRK